MRLRRTAAWGIVVALALGACSSSGDGSVASSVPVSSTVTPSTVTTVATTTTIATTTTSAPPPTTTVVADATTADPTVLAGQLQAVLDRFRELYVESRVNPSLPFNSQQFVDDMLKVTSRDYFGLILLPAWNQFRNDGTAVRNGPSGPVRDLLTAVNPVTSTIVDAEYCNYDDGQTFEVSSGAILDDTTVINRVKVGLVLHEDRWLVDRTEPLSEQTVPSGSANPCLNDAVVAG